MIIKELLKNGTVKIFPASDDALYDVLGFTEEKLETFGCSMKIQMALAVVVEEIFVNVAHYAYGEDRGNVTVTIGMGETEQGPAVAFSFKDSGVYFDPLAMEDPDITLKAEERDIGGLGILMVKKMTDGVAYEYEAGENCLMFMKYI